MRYDTLIYTQKFRNVCDGTRVYKFVKMYDQTCAQIHTYNKHSLIISFAKCNTKPKCKYTAHDHSNTWCQNVLLNSQCFSY